MACARDDATSDQCRKLRPLVWIFSSRPGDAVIRAIKSNHRHLEFRPLRETFFDFLKSRLARSITDAMAIRMNYYIDEIGIIKRWRRAIEGLVREMPGRRPRFPQITAQG